MDQLMTQPGVPAGNDTQDLQQRLRALRSGLQSESRLDETKLKKACQDFEAVFIGQLWKQMRASVPKEGMFHSKEEEQYLSMFDQELSLKMARSGGIGLSDMLYTSLSQRLVDASRDTTTAKPLLPLQREEVAAEAANRGALPETRTVDALAARQQAEMLARSIERSFAPEDVEEPKSVVQSTIADLEAAMRSVRMDDGDDI